MPDCECPTHIGPTSVPLVFDVYVADRMSEDNPALMPTQARYCVECVKRIIGLP